MANDLGYNKNLFILPFDHRSSFIKDMLEITSKNLTPQATKQIVAEKETIFEAFKIAVEYVPKDQAAILVDEQFGDRILRDARNNGFTTILTTEKSGQKEFTFEYNGDFSKHIEKYKPTFAKALIHYNPEDDEGSKIRQQQQLKILSDYCHNNGYKLLLEVLIPPTDSQFAKAHENKKLYDLELRPKLTVSVVEELQRAKVDPDVWKLEGMNYPKDYLAVVNQIQTNGRRRVGLVILGRAETKETVEKWILARAKVKGVIGFAVGRTVFWEPLLDLKNSKISREKAINQIANNFKYFYDVFMKGKRNMN
ncbi:MAG: DUF2090 domain-containing protein [Patescibacteria group bacterium]